MVCNFITTVFVYQIVSDNLVDIIVNLGLGQQFRVETLENGSGRIIAWQFAWQEIQNNLFLGIDLAIQNTSFIKITNI